MDPFQHGRFGSLVISGVDHADRARPAFLRCLDCLPEHALTAASRITISVTRLVSGSGYSCTVCRSWRVDAPERVEETNDAIPAIAAAFATPAARARGTGVHLLPVLVLARGGLGRALRGGVLFLRSHARNDVLTSGASASHDQPSNPAEYKTENPQR